MSKSTRAAARAKAAVLLLSKSPAKNFDFTVKDTGHFQNFIPRRVGTVNLSKGEHRFWIKPVKKARKCHHGRAPDTIDPNQLNHANYERN